MAVSDNHDVDAARISEEQDMLPRFRALKAGDYRRGIRLEQIYWDALASIAKARGITLAEYVAEVATRYPEAVNITSVLRVLATRKLRDENVEMRGVFDTVRVDALVQACPSPAFALREDKRIVSYNPAFISYVQSGARHTNQANVARRLRLSLDIQLEDLIAELRQSRKAVRSGFLLVVDDHKLRGQLTATLAPALGPATLLGYIAQA